MQSTQTQIFFGVAISCAFLLYSIAKQKSANKGTNKKKFRKTSEYNTFRTKQCQSPSATQNLKEETKNQRSEQQDKKINFMLQNKKQQPSIHNEKPQDVQPKDNSHILNQINDDEDQLFFKLGFRLLNSVKG
ncbi:unnamed protein product [Paramecium sonneborni]|uniref:Transmembrane protein n=1 Tax=Paramecium sonneborni TaxID=65129 RepID=A0A8S1NID2_9CILI|nr:unnamed protein product [Paramecium sonneborni]